MKWTKVEEANPDKSGMYIVYVPEHPLKVATSWFNAKGSNPNWDAKVKAWMPFPEPPVEDEIKAEE